MNGVHIIEVPSEIGAGTRGGSKGPEALRSAAEKAGSNIYQEVPSSQLPDRNDLLEQPSTTPFAKYVQGVAMICEATANKVEQVFMENSLPLVISGDHSVAAGTVAGVKLAHPESRLGLIWIDAHADLHSPYTTPSGHVHGMPLAAILNSDNLESRQNDPLPESMQYWEKMKGLAGSKPIVQFSDVCLLGVRDTEPPEKDLIQRKNIFSLGVAEIYRIGTADVLQQVWKQLEGCSHIYVSFDVDSLDPDISKGTGTPVANGFTLLQADEILTALCHDPRLCCLEFTEINPSLDVEKRMAEISFPLFEKCVLALRSNETART